MEFRFEAPATPHSLLENWFEGEGSSEVLRRHGRGKRSMSYVQRPTLNSKPRIAYILCPLLDVQCRMFDVPRSALISDFRRLTSG